MNAVVRDEICYITSCLNQQSLEILTGIGPTGATGPAGATGATGTIGNLTLLGDLKTSTYDIAWNFSFVNTSTLFPSDWTVTGSSNILPSASNSVLKVANQTLQSRTNVSYIPSKQIDCLFTSQLYTTGISNFDNEIGYGDTTSGIFFYAKNTGSGPTTGVRQKDGYGTTTDYPLSGFNGTKSNIFKISILWFGYWGFECFVYDSSINDFKLLIQKNFTNVQTLPFLKVPTLPFRISSTTAENIVLTCASINIIGGLSTFNKYVISSYCETLYPNISNGVYRPILALRLKRKTPTLDTSTISFTVNDIALYIDAGTGNYAQISLVYIPFNTLKYVTFSSSTANPPASLVNLSPWVPFMENGLAEYHVFQNTSLYVRVNGNAFNASNINTIFQGTGFVIFSDQYITGRNVINILPNPNVRVRYDDLNDGFNTGSNDNGNSSDLFLVMAKGSVNLNSAVTALIERF